MKYKKGYWIDRHGNRKRLVDMDLAHIENCLEFLRSAYTVLVSSQITNEMHIHEVFPVYDDLVREFKRRSPVFNEL